MKNALIVILGVTFLDQALKFWVKTNMQLYDNFNLLGNWFIIRFVENNGMAFGMEFGGDYGKIALSLFRILAAIVIAWYLYKYLIKKDAHPGLIVAVSLIFTGAFGNIIDGLVYGVIFSDSYYQIATIFPDGGGYATFLHGKVVDMIHVYIQKPAWLPWFWEDELFPPIFNIADTAITTGVLMILIFQNKFFKEEVVEEKEEIVVEKTE